MIQLKKKIKMTLLKVNILNQHKNNKGFKLMNI
jgi:hypothetical protein